MAARKQSAGVCGATIGQTPEENLDQIREGIAALLPQAESAGILPAIEPLHPMYAADRACVNTLEHALDLARRNRTELALGPL